MRMNGFGAITARERLEADLFFQDLTGVPASWPAQRRAIAEAEGLADAEADLSAAEDDPVVADQRVRTTVNHQGAVPFAVSSGTRGLRFVPAGFNGPTASPMSSVFAEWALVMDAQASGVTVQAMFSGALDWEPRFGSLVLTPDQGSPLGWAIRHLAPDWERLPTRLVYTGMSRAEAEPAIRALGGDTARFFAGRTSLRVTAGAPLTTRLSGAHDLHLLAVEERGSTTLRLNLAWLLARRPSYFRDLAGHPFLAEMTALRWPRWTASADAGPTVLFVHSTRGRDSGPFDSPAHPARSLRAAIAAATPFSTVIVLDGGSHDGEIVLDKPIHVASVAGLDPAARESTFPTIQGRNRTRCVRVKLAGRHGAFAPVTLRGFRVTGGRTMAGPSEPSLGAGAGIVVDGHDIVEISRCIVERSRANLPGPTPVDMRPMKADLERLLLGAVDAIPNAAGGLPLIGGPIRDQLNPLLDPLRQGVRDVVARIPNTLPGARIGPRAFGGGVAFLWSSGLLESSRVQNNWSGRRGGGVGVAGYGWPVLRGCTISGNEAYDGGGVGLENAFPAARGGSRDVMQQDLVDDMMTWMRSVGPLQLAEVLARFLLETVIQATQGARPGAVELRGAVLYLLASAWLGVRRWHLWPRAGIRAARVRFTGIEDCTVTENRSRDDGGGLYASVLSRAHVERSRFTNNRAVGGGGGLETTMGSDLTLVTCRVEGNQSRAPGSGGEMGGGGVAVRNGKLHIRALDEELETVITGNRCGGWAGGGVHGLDGDEGALAGIPNLWQPILVHVFAFDRMDVRIGPGVVITRNEAPDSAHGKGGGLYVLRGNMLGLPDLDIQILGLSRTIQGNTAHETASSQIRVVDTRGGASFNDASAAAAARGGNFTYSAVQPWWNPLPRAQP